MTTAGVSVSASTTTGENPEPVIVSVIILCASQIGVGTIEEIAGAGPSVRDEHAATEMNATTQMRQLTLRRRFVMTALAYSNRGARCRTPPAVRCE